MGCCFSKIENKDNNNKLINSPKFFYEREKNDRNKNDYIYNLGNKQKVLSYNKSSDLNINQKGDINNYNDIKKFEESL